MIACLLTEWEKHHSKRNILWKKRESIFRGIAQRGRKRKLHFLHFTTLTNLNFTMIVSLIESFYKSSKFFFFKGMHWQVSSNLFLLLSHGTGDVWCSFQGEVAHLGWINNQVVLYSTGNCTQSPGTDHNGKEYLKQNVYTCVIESLCWTAEISTSL